MGTSKQKKTYRIQALDRALDVLDCFSFESREMSLSELAHRTGLNMTTVKRMASNLTSRGYLRQDPKSKTYQLGMRLFELGGVVFSSFSLRKAASYHMSDIQHKTGETVLLAITMDEQLVYVDKRESKGVIRISSNVGLRRHLHYGALGMVLTAHLSPEKLRGILKKYPLESYTSHSITDEDAFSLRLGKIRMEGYAIERDEAVEGIMGIAAPVRDFSRKVIAALGVVFPYHNRIGEKEVRGIVDLVMKTSDAVSTELGYLRI